MSAGSPHRRPHGRRPEEVAKIEADPSFKQMWARPFRVDETKQIPDTAGYSVAGDVYYLDRDLVAALQAGVFHNPKTGKSYRATVERMTADQIKACLLQHERLEKCILDANNAVNLYEEAHELATTGEHQAVRLLDASPTEYEHALEPIIEWNEVKPLTDVPRDLQCSPYRDEPDANDKRSMKTMRALQVVDAYKLSKKVVHYREATGPKRCGSCEMMQGSGEIAPCDVVGGLVRNTLVCDRWVAKEDER